MQYAIIDGPGLHLGIIVELLVDFCSCGSKIIFAATTAMHSSMTSLITFCCHASSLNCLEITDFILSMSGRPFSSSCKEKIIE